MTGSAVSASGIFKFVCKIFVLKVSERQEEESWNASPSEPWQIKLFKCRSAARSNWGRHAFQGALVANAQHHGHQNPAANNQLGDRDKRLVIASALVATPSSSWSIYRLMAVRECAAAAFVTAHCMQIYRW